MATDQDRPARRLLLQRGAQCDGGDNHPHMRTYAHTHPRNQRTHTFSITHTHLWLGYTRTLCFPKHPSRNLSGPRLAPVLGGANAVFDSRGDEGLLRSLCIVLCSRRGCPLQAARGSTRSQRETFCFRSRASHNRDEPPFQTLDVRPGFAKYGANAYFDKKGKVVKISRGGQDLCDWPLSMCLCACNLVSLDNQRCEDSKMIIKKLNWHFFSLLLIYN